MFTGIVEELGVVKMISRVRNTKVLTLSAREVFRDIKVGESVAVNGVCLTVIQLFPETIVCEMIPETFKNTNLGFLRISDKVNLERSLKVGERISGHFVTGHIDCQGIIRKKHMVRGNFCVEVSISHQFAQYCIPKGCIAIDGISLTIAGRTRGGITVYIIPHTLDHTTLSFKRPSAKVNIEFDLLAKQAIRL